MYKYPKALVELIEILSQLPTVGPRSAARIAIHLASKRTDLLSSLATIAGSTENNIGKCNICNTLVEAGLEKCSICSDSRRDHLLMVVESIMEMQLIEEGGSYRGYYFLLGGLVSPLKGVTLETLGVTKLADRVVSGNFMEVILALPPSVEGDTTSLMLKDLLLKQNNEIKLSRLGRGIPSGAQLEYLDPQTLKHSISSKVEF